MGNNHPAKHIIMYRAREECVFFGAMLKSRWRGAEVSLPACRSVAGVVPKMADEDAEVCLHPWRSVPAFVPQYDHQSYRRVATFILRYEI